MQRAYPKTPSSLDNIMNRFIKFFAIAVLTIGLVSGCTSQVYHDYVMSGQVVSVSDRQAVICVSDTDGLKSIKSLTCFEQCMNQPR